MNIEKLKLMEQWFFERYPDGFDDAEIQRIVKRHNTAKIGESVRELFAPERFSHPDEICESFAKIVSKSTLISLFEKPKLQDAVKKMGMEQKDTLSIGLYELLHGKKEAGFNIMVEVLSRDKLAKWPLVTLIPYYYAREREIFVKPTTTKAVIAFFELEGLVYKPKPTYVFYCSYKTAINAMQSHVDASLSRDNAGFTGFLMMGMA